MRLINAHTLKLEEFWDETSKEYAILSHRWEGGEVSFQDMQEPTVASNMKGFTKIQKSCERAVIDGYNYVWVDTCCINKESSTELNEAINSMYRWYQASAACYVFLSDVHANALDSDTVEQQINSCLWFTRGWTLQELLAPQNVVFYDQQWEFLGTKRTLSKLLTLRTSIDEAILNGLPLSWRSVAQRMSWASQRVTTRKEDIAYCLLGIFDVNMPMLYGEGGEKAFLRLQEEIIKQSDDHTIFAWPIHRRDQPGLLADSPAAFEKCQFVRTMTSRKGRSAYSLTNRGLSIKLMADRFTTDTYVVRLDCVDRLLLVDDVPAGGDEPRLGMFLRRLYEDDQYARIQHAGKTFKLLDGSNWGHEQIEVNVRQQYSEYDPNNYKDRVNGFRIATPELLERTSSGEDRFQVSASSWNPEERIMSTDLDDYSTLCSLDISQQGRRIKVIQLGFDFEFHPVCFMATLAGTRARGYEGLLQGVQKRTSFHTTAWSEVQDGVAIDLRQEPGIWILKGDRVNGLDVRIGELVSLRNNYGVMEELAVLRIVRGEYQDSLVWDVHLDSVPKGNLSKISI